MAQDSTNSRLLGGRLSPGAKPEDTLHDQEYQSTTGSVIKPRTENEDGLCSRCIDDNAHHLNEDDLAENSQTGNEKLSAPTIAHEDSQRSADALKAHQKAPATNRTPQAEAPPAHSSEQYQQRLREMTFELAEDLFDLGHRDRYTPGPLSLAQKKQMPVKLLQSLQYANIMERRVFRLEAELTTLKRRLQTNDSEEKFDRSSLADAQANAYVKERLLPGAREIHYDDFTAQELTIKNVVTYLCDDTYARSGADELSDRPYRVSRVCVNSKLLRTWLAKIMPDGSGPDDEHRIFMAPFQAFCIYEQQIRDHLSDLEEELEKRGKCESLPSSKADNVPADITSVVGGTIGDPETDNGHDSPRPGNLPESLLRPDSDSMPFARARSPASAAEPDLQLNKQQTEAIQEGIDHFKALVNLFDTELKDVLDTHKALRNGAGERVRFFDLWHLFQPGQVVVSNEEGRQAFIVLGVRGGRPLYGFSGTADSSSDESSVERDERRRRRNRSEDRKKKFRATSHASPFTIDCVYLDFDGKDFGPVAHSVKIDYFHGESEISNLRVMPISLAKSVGGEAREAYLIKRGMKFETLARGKPSHHEYEGTSLVEKLKDGTKRSREQIDSHVIVDLEHAYLKEARRPEFFLPSFQGTQYRELPGVITGPCQCSPGCEDAQHLRHLDDAKFGRAVREKYLKSNKVLRLLQVLTNEHHILLPNYVYGYVLRNLDWYRLDIDLIKPVDPRKRANFEDLVLPENNRNLIQALVSAQRSNKSHSARGQHLDLVRGKGQGTIILLHGVPGTGKSSTAECVAEHLECPLFAITCGNIGTSPPEVEGNLRDMFYLAHKWNCVMLLDEADVFLQTRDERDMSRNAVVSVFLRSLEYYSGILFLTTNKVGTFDEAFVSRIHMSLYYPILDKKMTEEIWQVNMRRTREFRPHIEFDDLWLLEFARTNFEDQQRYNRVQWNGRQIRNAFQTAIALAEFQVEDSKNKNVRSLGSLSEKSSNPARAILSPSHFQKVAGVSADFNEYLRRTHADQDFSDKAQDGQYRYDKPHLGPQRSFQKRRTRPGTPSGFGNSGGLSPHSSNYAQQQFKHDGYRRGGNSSPNPAYQQWQPTSTEHAYSQPGPGSNYVPDQQHTDHSRLYATSVHHPVDNQSYSQIRPNAGQQPPSPTLSGMFPSESQNEPQNFEQYQ